MTPNPPCLKCGSKNGWEGPRYISSRMVPLETGVGWFMDELSYTCINCRFTRYEPPLDRRDSRPDTPIIPDSAESALNLADILDRKERNGI